MKKVLAILISTILFVSCATEKNYVCPMWNTKTTYKMAKKSTASKYSNRRK